MKIFTRVLVVFTVILAQSSFAEVDVDGGWSLRPYRCRFYPSNDIRKAIDHYEGKEVYRMERWGKNRDSVVNGIESECEEAVSRYQGHSVSSCFNYLEDQMLCKRKYRIFYEW